LFNISSSNDNNALIEEHDKLTASLAALTRHVAHVQFRLQQVLSAPTPEDREVKQNRKRFFFSLIFFSCRIYF